MRTHVQYTYPLLALVARKVLVRELVGLTDAQSSVRSTTALRAALVQHADNTRPVDSRTLCSSAGARLDSLRARSRLLAGDVTTILVVS